MSSKKKHTISRRLPSLYQRLNAVRVLSTPHNKRPSIPPDIINKMAPNILKGRRDVIIKKLLPSMVLHMRRNGWIVEKFNSYMPKGPEGERQPDWKNSVLAKKCLDDVTETVFPLTLGEKKNLLEELNRGKHDKLIASLSKKRKSKKKRRKTKKKRKSSRKKR